MFGPPPHNRGGLSRAVSSPSFGRHMPPPAAFLPPGSLDHGGDTQSGPGRDRYEFFAQNDNRATRSSLSPMRGRGFAERPRGYDDNGRPVTDGWSRTGENLFGPGYLEQRYADEARMRRGTYGGDPYGFGGDYGFGSHSGPMIHPNFGGGGSRPSSPMRSRPGSPMMFHPHPPAQGYRSAPGSPVPRPASPMRSRPGSPVRFGADPPPLGPMFGRAPAPGIDPYLSGLNREPPARFSSILDRGLQDDYGLSPSSKYATSRFEGLGITGEPGTGPGMIFPTSPYASGASPTSLYERSLSRYDDDGDIIRRAEERARREMSNAAAARHAADDARRLDAEYANTYASSLDDYRSGRPLNSVPLRDDASSPVSRRPNGNAGSGLGNNNTNSNVNGNANTNKSPSRMSKLDSMAAAQARDRPERAIQDVSTRAAPRSRGIDPVDVAVSQGAGGGPRSRGAPPPISVGTNRNLDRTVMEHVETAPRFCKLITESARGGATDGWEDDGEQNKVKITRKKFKGFDVDAHRGTIVIPYSAAAVFDFLRGNANTASYDPTFKESQLIQVIDEYTSVYRIAFTANGWFESARDFVLFEACEVQPDGTSVIMTRSINHPSAPEHDDYVRGEVKFSGYVIRPGRNNPDSCTVTKVVQIDPRGWLTTYIGNSLALTMVKTLGDLRTHLESHPPPNPGMLMSTRGGSRRGRSRFD